MVSCGDELHVFDLKTLILDERTLILGMALLYIRNAASHSQLGHQCTTIATSHKHHLNTLTGINYRKLLSVHRATGLQTFLKARERG